MTFALNLANLAGQALDQGARYVAYRDAGEIDLPREVARFIGKRHDREQILVVAESAEAVLEIKKLISAFTGKAPPGRISQTPSALQVGTLAHALRRVRYPAGIYSLVILMPGLDRAGKAALIAALPGAAVLDADPAAGRPLRQTDHVIYRGSDMVLGTLQSDGAEPRYRH
jgi:hypothetical protein